MTAWPRARWRRCVLILGVAVVLAALLVPMAASAVGRWLVVADPLQPARAVVVLSGRVPFRAMKAASIYKAGMAPEVWISRPLASPEEMAMHRLGLAGDNEAQRNQRVLERLGVSPGAIRVLDRPIVNTMEEVQVVVEALRSLRADSVILVTSKPHTRRVKAIWRTLVGDTPRLLVQHPEDEPFDADRWWRHTGDALEVSREVFGLMNVWAGFPVRPDRAEALAARGGP